MVSLDFCTSKGERKRSLIFDLSNSDSYKLILPMMPANLFKTLRLSFLYEVYAPKLTFESEWIESNGSSSSLPLDETFSVLISSSFDSSLPST